MGTIQVRLHEYLKEHGLSAYRLGKKVAGVSPKTIYAITSGRSRPSLEALERIVEALRELTGEVVKPGDLLEYHSRRASAKAPSGRSVRLGLPPEKRPRPKGPLVSEAVSEARQEREATL